MTPTELDDLFEWYRAIVESDRATGLALNPGAGALHNVTVAVAAWRGRYSRLHQVLDRLPEDVRRRAMTRGIKLDMEIVQIPDWSAEEWQAYDLIEAANPDWPKVTGLHAYGPSLRALWAEAKTEGATNAEAWQQIVAWARRPPDKADFDEEVFINPPAMREEPRPLVYVPPPDLDPEALLPRYRGGEHTQVWADLVALGPLVQDARYRPHAEAVATATMRRARQNVELLVERLTAVSYRFWDGQDELHQQTTITVAYAGSAFQMPNLARYLRPPQRARTEKDVHTPPGPDLEADIRALEEQGLRLPIALRAWYQEVGEVDLSGRHPELCQFDTDPDFNGVLADPLMVFLEPSLLEGSHPPFELWIALDAENKAAQASGDQVDGSYSLEVPSELADANLLGERHGQTFVEHLRTAFQWAGFPGWQHAENPPRALIDRLTAGLLPL